MNAGHPHGDGQPQAEALHLAPGWVRAIEPPKDERQIRLRDANSVVLHRHRYFLPCAASLTLIVPGAGVYFTALSRRIHSNCWRLE